MMNCYYELMEKYSSYSREYLEGNYGNLKEHWLELKKKLVSFCDIDSVGYKLDLTDEKLIGKAPVKEGITTNEDAFSHLENINYTKDNTFLLSKRLTGKNKKY